MPSLSFDYQRHGTARQVTSLPELTVATPTEWATVFHATEPTGTAVTFPVAVPSTIALIDVQFEHVEAALAIALDRVVLAAPPEAEWPYLTSDER